MNMREITAISIEAENASAGPPLCVDLDGTLVHGDTLHEEILALLIRAPWLVFKLLRWLFIGKAHFKWQVAHYAALDPTLLPYDERVLVLVRHLIERGRMSQPVTAADGD